MFLENEKVEKQLDIYSFSTIFVYLFPKRNNIIHQSIEEKR
ncbi:hypothetical protein HMPREF1146_0799 [Prevotella sp. MSX73]|uniref:Uncharacterized protein n=1 Tax=Segatella buccae ATCC 33574 TaxID=873513 RepID=E6K5B0_9BACT|nr:hypothetical protein HMPREF6485_0944 [Segatella buccae ATCC 33574]EJP33506.1 hypothetical protein HMPREF1146_0799 [Prevotella sp. MSX73]